MQIDRRLYDTEHGTPSTEAVLAATDAMRRQYVLPETMQHEAIRTECLGLAYLIQAYGLASISPATHDEPYWMDAIPSWYEPTVTFHDTTRARWLESQDDRMLDLA